MFVIYYGETALYATGTRNFGIASAVITQSKNAADSFVFVLPAVHPYRDAPQIRQDIVKVVQDGRTIFAGDVISARLRLDNSREIACQGCLAWLNDVVQLKLSGTQSAQDNFTARMARYNAQCTAKRTMLEGVCTVTGNVKIKHAEEYTNLFDLFREMISQRGGQLLPRYADDSIYIDYLSSKDKTSGQVIYFGQNLLDLDNYISAENTISRLYPIGNGGITIASVEPSSHVYVQSDSIYAKYGAISATAKYDADTPAELLALANSALNALAVLNQTITLTAVDLSMFDASIDGIDIGDTVRAVSAPHGLDTSISCSGKTIDLLNPAKSSVTLGKTLKSLSKIIALGGIK